MSTRFMSNALIALLGGLVVVLSMGLSSTTAVGWSAFGIAIGVLAIAALAQLDSRRGLVQRLLDVATIAVAGTLVGTSVMFTGTTLMWLVFALALGSVGVAFAGLAVHEIDSWRAIRELEGLRIRHLREPAEQRGREVGAQAA